MLELIAFVVFIVIFVALLINNIIIRIKNRLLVKEAIQLNIDKIVLVNRIEELLAKQENKTLEESDGFIKFVSESRDWAFQYIEDVQEAISHFDKTISSKDDMQIEKAYDKLKNFLPKEEENNNTDNNEEKK